MLRARITTIDNPHDPFDDYPAWYTYDTSFGYNTSALLARIAVVSDELSDAQQEQAIRDAIDEMIRENVSGKYRIVEREVEETFLA